MKRTIRFRATEKEYNMLKDYAGKLSMSEYIRIKLFGPVTVATQKKPKDPVATKRLGNEADKEFLRNM